MKYILVIATMLFCLSSFSQDSIPYKSGSQTTSPEVSKQSLESLQLKYTKHRKAGVGCLATGGALFLIGSSLTSSGFLYGSDVVWIAGLSAVGAGIPLLIAGGVEIKRYAKYKREWKKEKRLLSFAPNVNLNSFGASMNFTF